MRRSLTLAAVTVPGSSGAEARSSICRVTGNPVVPEVGVTSASVTACVTVRSSVRTEPAARSVSALPDKSRPEHARRCADAAGLRQDAVDAVRSGDPDEGQLRRRHERRPRVGTCARGAGEEADGHRGVEEHEAPALSKPWQRHARDGHDVGALTLGPRHDLEACLAPDLLRARDEQAAAWRRSRGRDPQLRSQREPSACQIDVELGDCREPGRLSNEGRRGRRAREGHGRVGRKRPGRDLQ